MVLYILIFYSNRKISPSMVKKTKLVEESWSIATPHFTNYLIRIGAEQTSFKRGMIKQRLRSEKGDHYYSEMAVISVAKDNSVKINGEFQASVDRPTAEEAEAIKGEFIAIRENLPKSIYATDEQAEAQRKKLGISADSWFPLRTFDRKQVIMVQERWEKEGKKEYYPWTFYANGEWRKYEPDGENFKLPFWKPKERTNCPLLMVHEGAKAADFAHNLVNNPSALWNKRRKEHPWYEFLKVFEHWGIIGGAEAPHRADYKELLDYAAGRLVYVCDRDKPGEAAAQKVSRLYRRKMDILRFNETKFPVNWDIADPLPDCLYYNNDRNNPYTGPEASSFLAPATWATDIVPPPEGTKGRPTIALRQEFVDEWYHAIRPEVYIHSRFPEKVYSPDEFENAVRPFSDTEHVAKRLQKHNVSKVQTITYIPGHASGGTTQTELFGLAFNTHTPTNIKPIEGDIGPWLEYLDNVFPIENDRKEIRRWCYTLIARLDIKMSYGLLLCSESQGVGKTTLGQNILAPLVGYTNVRFPSESDITNGSFTDWKAKARLLIVNEIYAGQSSKAYNILKDLITDRWIRINGKYAAPYDQENWGHMIANSNSMRALKLPDDDRRWYVPKVTEKVLPPSYWKKFNQWLVTGGLAHILFDAQQWSMDCPEEVIMHGDRAPDSTAKQIMIEASYSTGMALVADWLEEHRDGEPLGVTVDALIQYIKSKIYDGRHNEKLERAATIRKVAKHKGWYGGESQTFVATELPKTRLLVNKPGLEGVTASQLAREGVEVYVEFDGIGFVAKNLKI